MQAGQESSSGQHVPAADSEQQGLQQQAGYDPAPLPDLPPR